MVVFKKIFRAICSESAAWIGAVIANTPGRAGVWVRRFWLKTNLARLGPGLYSERGVEIRGAGRLFVGSGVFLFRGCMLSAEAGKCSIGDDAAIGVNVIVDASSGEILIGRHVMIAPNVVLRASNHRFENSDQPMQAQGHVPGLIVIEDDVWIGANATVLSNVRIGAHAIVGAGAVVTRDVEPWTIVGGVPARPLKRRQT